MVRLLGGLVLGRTQAEAVHIPGSDVWRLSTVRRVPDEQRVKKMWPLIFFAIVILFLFWADKNP